MVVFYQVPDHFIYPGQGGVHRGGEQADYQECEGTGERRRYPDPAGVGEGGQEAEIVQ